MEPCSQTLTDKLKVTGKRGGGQGYNLRGKIPLDFKTNVLRNHTILWLGEKAANSRSGIEEFLETNPHRAGFEPRTLRSRSECTTDCATELPLQLDFLDLDLDLDLVLI